MQMTNEIFSDVILCKKRLQFHYTIYVYIIYNVANIAL